MATAVAADLEDAVADAPFSSNPHGVQGLLQPTPDRPHYKAQLAAAAIYALLLGLTVTLSFKAAEVAIEEQQVIELAPLPAEEPPLEDVLPEPEELTLPEPPPPMLDPIAPVEEAPKPKPVEKPKVEKKVEPRPRNDAKPAPAQPRAAAPTGARTDAPAVRAPAAPPGATPSAIANQFHACMQRAAANAYPEAMAPRTAHIAYHASFSATGSMTSFSISPSGIGPFDAVANRLGARCGSVAAPGKPVSLSGAFTFSP
jgi:protein TonB